MGCFEDCQSSSGSRAVREETAPVRIQKPVPRTCLLLPLHPPLLLASEYGCGRPRGHAVRFRWRFVQSLFGGCGSGFRILLGKRTLQVVTRGRKAFQNERRKGSNRTGYG